MPDPILNLPGEMLDQDVLFERLEAGSILITANKRLSRILRERYNRRRLEFGDEAWKSPVILPWDAWLAQTWEEAALEEESALAVQQRALVLLLLCELLPSHG